MYRDRKMAAHNTGSWSSLPRPSLSSPLLLGCRRRFDKRLFMHVLRLNHCSNFVIFSKLFSLQPVTFLGNSFEQLPSHRVSSNVRNFLIYLLTL